MKILILDEQGLFIDAVSLFLERVEPEMEIVSASNVEKGFSILRQHNDIALILINPEKVSPSGLSVLDEFKSMLPDIPFGLIAEPMKMDSVLKAMEQGAVGYFPKNMRAEAFVQALRFVLAGEKFLPCDIGKDDGITYYKKQYNQGVQEAGEQAGFSYQGFFSGDRQGQNKQESQSGISMQELSKLSAKELQTLRFIGKSMTNKQIAAEMNVKEVTTKQHVSAILRKLDLDNRTQIAMVARDYNLL